MKLLVVAVGQRMPDWAQTAWDDYAKRFPPELKLELRAVKTEPRGSKSLETVLPGESPTAYVQRVTALKLDAAVARLRRRGLADAPVLCADTTVALGRTILGKPEDARDAERMLALLSGTTHRVLTAVALQQGE